MKSFMLWGNDTDTRRSLDDAGTCGGVEGLLPFSGINMVREIKIGGLNSLKENWYMPLHLVGHFLIDLI